MVVATDDEPALGFDVPLATAQVQVENLGYVSRGAVQRVEGVVMVGDGVAIGRNVGACSESHCREHCMEEARVVGESLIAPHDDTGYASTETASREGADVHPMWGRCSEDASKVGVVVTDFGEGAVIRNAKSKGVDEEAMVAAEGSLVHFDHSSKGGFKLINKEPLDPIVFSASRKMWRGKSSSKRGRSLQIRDNGSGGRSRLVIPTSSNSITDSNIFNCNRRIKGLDNGIEELRLWGIAKEIGIVCKESEDSIIQRFSEMEEWDSKMLREATYYEDGNLF